MTGYKQIIKNMVEAEVTRFVEKKSEKFINVDSVELHTDSGLSVPSFDAEVTVDFADINKRDYLIHGYVSEYGTVVITMITFERVIKKSWETDFHKVNEFIAAEELKTFKFDR